MDRKSLNILIVEDDEIDAMNLQRAFDSLRIANPVRRALDGVEALEILRGENGHERMARPYAILLDLNMPRMNGIEFLEAIRSDDTLKGSLVFVLTTSDDERDRLAAYRQHVAGYILKHDAARTFEQAIMQVAGYWRIIEVPPPSD